MPGVQKKLNGAKNSIFQTKPVHISYGYMDKDYGGPHKGADLLAGSFGVEDKIVAIEDGVVDYVKDGVSKTLPVIPSSFSHPDALGNNIIIKHSELIKSRYCHLKNGSICVKNGQKVKKGEVIGVIGNTGCSSGMHVHFEIHSCGERVDPEPYLMGNVSCKTGNRKPKTDCALYTAVDTLNVRKTPSKTSAVISVLQKGNVVDVYNNSKSENGGITWVKINHDGKDCFASLDYLKPIKS